MEQARLVRVSKRLSRHLRHDPAAIGLALQPGGWVEVGLLLAALARHGLPLTRDELAEVVAHNDKQRFAFSEDGTRIRANQGHSVPVDLRLPLAQPPEILYHGTVAKVLPAIREAGLLPMNRHDVHLSADRETAIRVGSRRGRPVVLVVPAGEMARAGHEFRVSANGVWLTSHVPPGYLRGAGMDPR
ncbi:RNA 2'-phosphotransferase [Amycolatopsis rhizosphaerae]|uniref:Probable RNA 2'-phosphotransferase n=1 Tax=Amycolatopsis rhizosphaerae TaxID=2053003 RepID=A0A558CDX6_9PSEU|nr:RNA 2'-phosphotransferase [Amycolatopsis rhizosphaerae]TVT46971.1 RNA 2'-phosphotransferase [Amycolatopsis rhizosphaerae]